MCELLLLGESNKIIRWTPEKARQYLLACMHACMHLVDLYELPSSSQLMLEAGYKSLPVYA